MNKNLKLQKDNRWSMLNNALMEEFMNNALYYANLMQPYKIEIRDSINCDLGGKPMLNIMVRNISKTHAFAIDVSFSMLKYAPKDFERLLLRIKEDFERKNIY